ncbi:MAG: CPBP family intramembrane metalloprotease, partial [Ruminococcus sp.]|nr:CPBP family intramembrane metalloprotease [Ruminococcus sp.]
SMNHVTFNKKGTIKYLFRTFLIAWIMQFIVAVLTWNGLAVVGKLLTAVMMFVPLLSVLLSGQKLKGMGWKPRLKGKIKTLLAAWFLPAVLTAVGAVLYFLVFPSHFDLSGEYLAANAGAEVLEQLEAQGLTYPMYILINIIGVITYIPLLNMLAAVGEEAGWRGFLYPQLKARFGRKKGLLIGGVIWGAWHFPMMWLIGYEYGMDYVGFPFVGMLLFCIFATACGILCDWVYEKTGCIWLPSILHGGINCAATIPLALCIPNTGSAILLGPAPHGLIAGIPTFVFAVILLLKSAKPFILKQSDSTE